MLSWSNPVEQATSISAWLLPCAGVACSSATAIDHRQSHGPCRRTSTDRATNCRDPGETATSTRPFHLSASRPSLLNHRLVRQYYHPRLTGLAAVGQHNAIQGHSFILGFNLNGDAKAGYVQRPGLSHNNLASSSKSTAAQRAGCSISDHG